MDHQHTPPFERRTVGQYTLVALLGEGGLANTWLAEGGPSGERLAIKELRLLKQNNAKQIELFERECATLRELDHPQIPRFIDTIVERRTETISLYLVQELIEGESLQQQLDRGVRFSPRDVVAVMKSCLAPLIYLHSRTPPLFHRDIKPSNIIRRPDGSCVLIDFGAVREALLDNRGGGSSVVGTFGYMAPEQFQARAFPGTDLYGLAATALHLLTGVEPARFPLRRLKPDIHVFLKTDPHLAAILDILIEPASEDRYASAHSLLNALVRWEAAAPSEPLDTTPTGPDAVVSTPTGPVAANAASTGPVPSGTPEAHSTTSPAVDPAGQVGETAPTAMTSPSPVQAMVAVQGPATMPHPAMPLAAVPPAAAPAAPSGDASAPSAEASPQLAVAGAVELPSAPPFSTGDWMPPAALAAPIPPAAPAAPVAPEAPAGPPEPTPEPARQELAEDPTGARAHVVTERAPAYEACIPGGQGAREAGIGTTALGALVAIIGLIGPMEYNAGAWIAAGCVVAAYGLLLYFAPRRPAGRTSTSVAQGPLTPIEVQRIVRRIAFLGPAEWMVDYSFLGPDELHYANRHRLPSAKAAKEAAIDPTRLQARYASDDPEASALVVLR